MPSPTAPALNGADPAPDAAEQAASPLSASLLSRLQEMIPEIREELVNLDKRREMMMTAYQAQRETLAQEHQAKLGSVEVERKRLHGLLKSMGEEPPERPQVRGPGRPGGRGGRPAGRKTSYGSVSSAKAREIADKILTLDQGSKFSVLDIYEAMGGVDPKNAGHTYAAFAYLHSIDFLDKAGKNLETKREEYRVYDRDALDKVEGAGAAPPPAAKVKRPRNIAPDTIARYVTAIGEIDKEVFTVPDIIGMLGGLSGRSAYPVFSYLAEAGVVTKVPHPPGSPKNLPDTYRRGSEEAAAEMLGELTHA